MQLFIFSKKLGYVKSNAAEIFRQFVRFMDRN